HGQPDSETWFRFVDRSARELEKVRTALAGSERGGLGVPPRSIIYSTAISLLGDSEPMRDELVRAGDRLGGKDAPMIIWGCLRSGFYRMRMRATADVENRAKTWRRLQPIVAQVRERAGWDISDDEFEARYSDDLCTRVAAHIREYHPQDHNLPREPETVKAYFAQFCEDFFEPGELYDINAEEVELLP